MDIEELTTQLQSQVNITRIVEIKPYSSLLVVCRVEGIDELPPFYLERIAAIVEKKITPLLEGQKFSVIITPPDFELDFYRIDPNG